MKNCDFLVDVCLLEIYYIFVLQTIRKIATLNFQIVETLDV